MSYVWRRVRVMLHITWGDNVSKETRDIVKTTSGKTKAKTIALNTKTGTGKTKIETKTTVDKNKAVNSSQNKPIYTKCRTET